MGPFGWGDLIAVVAVLISAASVVVTVRTSRASEAAARRAAQRQEHMAQAFDRLVAAAQRIADAAGRTTPDGAPAPDNPSAPADPGAPAPATARADAAAGTPHWQIENPEPGAFLLRNLSGTPRYDVRITDSEDASGARVAVGRIDPLGSHRFTAAERTALEAPGSLWVSDAEHPEPTQVRIDPWFGPG